MVMVEDYEDTLGQYFNCKRGNWTGALCVGAHDTHARTLEHTHASHTHTHTPLQLMSMHMQLQVLSQWLQRFNNLL